MSTNKPHPTHIDIPPPQDDSVVHADDHPSASIGPSGDRPTPARGILKNPLRRPSQIGNDAAISPATDEQRQAQEQFVLPFRILAS